MTGPAIWIKKAKIDIWVGIDYGTSATKIAFRRMDEIDRVYPVLFNHGLRCYPAYCLPSLAAFDENSQLLLGTDAAGYLECKPWDSGIRRLKVLLAGSVSEKFRDDHSLRSFRSYVSNTLVKSPAWGIESLSAAFLASAMIHTHMAVQERLRKQSDEIDLRFNVGVPIDYLENNPVRIVFDKIVSVAHSLYVTWLEGGTMPNEASVVLSRLSSWVPTGESSRRAFLIPELVAEAASYLVSLEARDGIHAIVDFGAGTTDIGIFRLEHGRPGLSAKWYAAGVLARGTHRIEMITAEYLKSSGRPCNEVDVAAYVTKLGRTPVERQVRDELYELWRETRDVWMQAYSKYKGQSLWTRDAVRVFASGGGAKFPYVEEIFSQSWMSTPGQDWGPYPVDVLPVPDNYISQDSGAPFQRMSVAYGLTIPEPKLEAYVLPRDAPDDTPPPLPIREGKHDWRWLNY